MELNTNQVANMFVLMTRGATEERVREALTVLLSEVHSSGYRRALSVVRGRLDKEQEEYKTDISWNRTTLENMLY